MEIQGTRIERALRPAINMFMPFAPPHRPLPRRKSNRELSMTGFLPKIVASEPVHGRNAVAARLYALMTQIKSLPCRSATMVGNAVDTMSYVEERVSPSTRVRQVVANRTASNALTNRARQTARKTSQKPVPRSGAGIAVVIVPLSSRLSSRLSSSVLVASVAASSLMFEVDIPGSIFVEYSLAGGLAFKEAGNPSAAGCRMDAHTLHMELGLKIREAGVSQFAQQRPQWTCVRARGWPINKDNLAA